MSSPRKRTFSLPEELSTYIDQMVQSGAYASGSEVVRAGIRSLQERDAAIERWLREDVATALDAVQANPGGTLSARDAFDAVRARHADRSKRTA